MLQREVIKVIIGWFGLWCLTPLLTIFQSCTVLMWHFFLTIFQSCPVLMWHFFLTIFQSCTVLMWHFFLKIFQSCTVLRWHFFYNRNWAQRCQLRLAQNLELKWLLLIYFSRKELSEQYRIKSKAWDLRCNEKSLSSKTYHW